MLIWFTITKSDRKTDRKVMQVNKQKSRHTDRWLGSRQMDGRMERQTDGHIDKLTYGEMGIRMNVHKDR
jgi:hypothetical protein